MSEQRLLLKRDVDHLSIEIWNAEADLGVTSPDRSTFPPERPHLESLSLVGSDSDEVTPERNIDADAERRTTHNREYDKPTVQRRLAVEQVHSMEHENVTASCMGIHDGSIELLQEAPGSDDENRGSCRLTPDLEQAHCLGAEQLGAPHAQMANGAQATSIVAFAPESAAPRATKLVSKPHMPSVTHCYSPAWECFLESLCGFRGLVKDMRRQRLSGVQFATSPEDLVSIASHHNPPAQSPPS